MHRKAGSRSYRSTDIHIAGPEPSPRSAHELHLLRGREGYDSAGLAAVAGSGLSLQGIARGLSTNVASRPGA